jgi:hypothetical protein
MPTRSRYIVCLGDLLVILAVHGSGDPLGWLLVFLPLWRAVVGSVHDIPATAARVRVLVHNGALPRVSCTTPLAAGDVSLSAPSRSPRSFGTPIGKVRLRHFRWLKEKGEKCTAPRPGYI